MKKEDALPGRLVRVPDKEGRGNARQVMLQGGPSLAGIILGYGRYHLSKQGLCGEVVVTEESWTDNGVVVLTQKPLGWNSPKMRGDSRYERRLLIDGETEWEIRKFSLQSVMAHEEWLAAGESVRLIKMEVDALNARAREIMREQFELTKPWVEFDHTKTSFDLYVNQSNGQVGITVAWQPLEQERWMPNAPAEVIERLNVLAAEQADIIKRMSCTRR